MVSFSPQKADGNAPVEQSLVAKLEVFPADSFGSWWLSSAPLQIPLQEAIGSA